MFEHRKHRALAVALACAAASTTQSAWSQAGGDSRSKNAGVLEEVTVFARRRAESLQDVPVSVTAVGGEQFAQRALKNLVEMGTVIPNAVIDTQSNGPTTLRIFIRGNGTQIRESSADPSVGIYLDGVYLGKNRGVNLDLFDVESVEVLRGPQGTLFGRNTTAGALVIRTLQPDFDDPELRIEGRFGNYGRQDLRVYGNVALGDNLAANVSIGRLDSNGYFYNAVTNNNLGGDDTVSLRTNLRYRPNDSLDLTLGVDYTKIDMTPLGTLARVGEINQTGVFGPQSPIPPLRGLIAAFGGITPGLTTGTEQDPFTVYQNQDGVQDFEIFGVRGNAKILLGGGHELELIGSYREHDEAEQLDFEGTSIPLLNTDISEEYYQVFAEAKLVRDTADALNYTAGINYFLSDYEATQQPQGADFTGSSISAYAELNYDFSDRLTGFLGARYVYDDREIDRYVTAAPESAINLDDDFTGWAGRLGFDYALSDDVLLYAVLARGYKSGSFNAYPPVDPLEPSFDPETVDSFEVGAKTELFDNRLRLNGALFYAVYDDLQVITVDGAVAAATILNAGRSTAYGAEFEAQLALPADLTLSATLGLLDAEFDDDEVVVGLQNREIPLSPEITASFQLNYDRYWEPLGARVTAGITAAYRDQYAMGVGDGPTPNQFIEPDRWLLDANVGLDWERYYANFVVKNLTDHEYFAQTLPIDSIGVAPATAGAPRLYELSLGVRF